MSFSPATHRVGRVTPKHVTRHELKADRNAVGFRYAKPTDGVGV